MRSIPYLLSDGPTCLAGKNYHRSSRKRRKRFRFLKYKYYHFPSPLFGVFVNLIAFLGFVFIGDVCFRFVLEVVKVITAHDASRIRLENNTLRLL